VPARPAGAAVHRVIASLKCAAPLRLDDRTLIDAKGRAVGKLDKKCQLPAGRVMSVRVLAIVRRTRAQSAAKYQDALELDEWEVVVPEVVIAP
jgi:hypothetical protein